MKKDSADKTNDGAEISSQPSPVLAQAGCCFLQIAEYRPGQQMIRHLNGRMFLL